MTTTAARTASAAEVAAPPRIKAGTLQRWLMPLGFLVLVLVAWQVLPNALDIPSYVLPELSAVLNALLDPAALPRYIYNAGYTLLEAGLGLLIGASAGIILGMLLAEVKALYLTLYPYIVAIQSIPKVALAPLFVIWFGFGIESKIVVVVLLTFFPVLVNTINGIKSVAPEQIDLFRVNGASAWQTRRKLLLPGALPYIFTGLEIAVVMAMLGAIVAEFVGAQNGLGVLVLQAQAQMQTAAVFALLIILSVIGITLNLTVRLIRARVVFWVPKK
ncbi:ABC transporter permease [Humidisolicoccus flavus]|uniref:ABC transporter permease n=1 Tax=Humidisolicoccus flavus TaxID=3111414 RepID=UPI00324A2DDF